MKTKLNFTEEYRVDSMDEVEQLHEDAKEAAMKGGYELSGFTWIKKEKKSKGAVIDEGFLCKVTKHYNDFFMNGLEA